MDAERDTLNGRETIHEPNRGRSQTSRDFQGLTSVLLVLLLAGCGKVERPAKPKGTVNVRIPPAPEKVTNNVRTAAPVAVFFSDVWRSTVSNRANPANIAGQCAQVIDSARFSLDVCVEEIDDPAIIDAIIRAHRRGVRVRVVTESDFLDERGPKSFRAEGIEVVGDNRSARMHNKFMVVDKQAVWTGSCNFAMRCAYRNNNNAVLIASPELAENFAEKFRWFWELKKFGGRPSSRARIPHAAVKLSDGTVVDSYFAVHDQVHQEILELVRKSQHSIRFLAFRFTNDELAQALLERAEEGVKVQGVLDSRQNAELSEFDRLRTHRNVEVLLDGNKHDMHHTIMILDDEIVVAGSMDFEAGSGEQNDENVVVFHSGKLAERYNDEFSRIYRSAITSLAGKHPDLNRY
ncbi:MAG: phospholipase D-like domain-containing protein [Planctomycetota bacterium]